MPYVADRTLAAVPCLIHMNNMFITHVTYQIKHQDVSGNQNEATRQHIHCHNATLEISWLLYYIFLKDYLKM